MNDPSGNYSETWSAPGYRLTELNEIIPDVGKWVATHPKGFFTFYTKSAAHFWLWLRWQLEKVS